MKLYHGSCEHGLTTIRNPYEIDCAVWGMFFSESLSDAQCHGNDVIYTIEVAKDDILNDVSKIKWDEDIYQLACDYLYDIKNMELFLGYVIGDLSIWKDKLSGEERTNIADACYNATGWMPDWQDNTELDLAFQSIASFVADKAGYKAVELENEQGISYLVVPGGVLHEVH